MKYSVDPIYFLFFAIWWTQRHKNILLGVLLETFIQQSSESLAGRIAYIELPPFSLFEVGQEAINTLWGRGGFPRSFLASSEKASYRWRQEYIKTFLECDLALSGFDVEPATLRRFWQMLAHYHGQTFNASEIASSLGFTSKTSKRYIISWKVPLWYVS